MSTKINKINVKESELVERYEVEKMTFDAFQNT